MKAIQLIQNELSKSYRDVNFEVGDTVKVHYKIDITVTFT